MSEETTGIPPAPGAGGNDLTQPKIFAAAAIVVIVAILAYWFLSGGGVRASDLDVLPANSSLVLVVDVDEVYGSPLGETIRLAFAGPYADLEDEMREEMGFGPDQVSHLVLGGDVAARMPCILVVMKDSLEAGTVDRIVEAMRLDPEHREVGGRKMWTRRDRMALGWVRSDAILVGMPGDVERALRGERRRSKVAEILADEGGLDASVAVVFDWTAAPPLRRDFERAFGEAAPLLFKHGGPIVAKAEVDGGVRIEAKLLDSRGERVRARYSAEVDGEFLEELLTDIGRVVGGGRRRRPPPEEWPLMPPEPAVAPDTAVPTGR